MSVYEHWVTGTIANGVATTGVINLGRESEWVEIVLPTLDSGTIKVQVCDTATGTFIDLGANITTATTTGNYADTWVIGGYQFIKIVSSANQTAERTIKLRGFKM